MNLLSFRRASNSSNSTSEEVRRRVDRVRRPSLPVIAQEDVFTNHNAFPSSMNSVGRHRSRRPSLADWTDVMNRYPSMDFEERRFEPNGVILVEFPEIDGPDCVAERVVAIPGKRLDDCLEGRLRHRGLSVEKVAFYLDNSHSAIPEYSDVKYLWGRKIIVRCRNTMRITRHSRAGQSMEDAQEKPRRKISEDSVARKTSFVNSRVLAKSRQQSESRSGNGSEEVLDFSRSRDSSQRDLSHLDEPSCSDNLTVDDGGTRRARSTASSRISLFFGKEKTEMLNRLNSFKEYSKNRTVPELELEDHWTFIVKNHQQISKRDADQQEAIWEVVFTEQRYIYLLKNMRELARFLEELQKLNFLKEIRTDAVFLNYAELYDNHLKFWNVSILQMLEYSRDHGVALDPSFMFPGFEGITEWSQCYLKFHEYQEYSRAYVTKWMKDHEMFKEFVMWAESQDCMRRQKMLDVLVAPMQRITKYDLLLQKVLKHSCDEKEQMLIHAMIDRTAAAVEQLNHEMLNNKLRQKMADFMNNIESYDCIDHDEFDKLFPQRKCILHLTDPMPMMNGPPMYRQIATKGELKVREGRQGPKIDMQCIIFTDMFLMCKKKGDKLRVVRPPIHITNLVYHPFPDRSGFYLLVMNEFRVPSSLYLMSTANEDDTRKWLEILKITIDEFCQLQSTRMRFDNGGSPLDEMRQGPFISPTCSLPSIIHRKSSSMDSQVVAAHAHLQHIKKKTTVSSTEQLDRNLESPSRMPPRHKLSVASCHNGPISQSKSFADLHMGTNGHDRAISPEATGRSRSNSTGPVAADPDRSRTPSPVGAGSRASNLTPRDSSPIPPSPDEPCSNSPALLVTSIEDEEQPQPGSVGRRFEKRYHTSDAIDLMKPKTSSMPTGILKRFSWNVSSAVGSSSRKINSRLMEQHSRRHSQSSTVASVASSESFGSSTSGISSSGSHLENGHDDDVTLKSHVSTVCVGETHSDGDTLSISLDSPKSTPTAECPSAPTPPAVQAPPIVCTPSKFEEPVLLEPAIIQYPQVPMKAQPLDPDLTLPPTVCHDNITDSKHRELLKLIMDNRLETSDV